MKHFEKYYYLYKNEFKFPVYVNYKENKVFFDWGPGQGWELIKNPLTNPWNLLSKFNNLEFYSADSRSYELFYKTNEWRSLEYEEFFEFVNR